MLAFNMIPFLALLAFLGMDIKVSTASGMAYITELNYRGVIYGLYPLTRGGWWWALSAQKGAVDFGRV